MLVSHSSFVFVFELFQASSRLTEDEKGGAIEGPERVS